VRALTVATKSDGYYPLLLSSADQFGYELTTLGSGEEWTGMAGKMIRYRDELSRYDPDTLVMLVDAYDVVFAAPAWEAESLFKHMQLPYLLSGQRYFASSPFIRHLADEVMGLDRSGRFLPTLGEEAYGRPCMGALMGWAGSLVILFTQLVALEDEHQTGNDQILINLFLEKHPDAAHVDRRCTIFQNLWRTRGRLPINGVFHPSDPEAEVRVLPSGRPENRLTGTRPQVIHGFMDLDMNPLLESLGYDTAGVKQVSGAEYFDYSIKTYLKIFLDRQVEAVRRLLRR
jgi:hypothetical protein